jgi:hypothetical protein
MTEPITYWNPDNTFAIQVEFIGDIIQFYYLRKFDNLEQQPRAKLCHVPCRDSPSDISRARREGRGYVYWLDGDYFLVGSSINPVSYNSVFDLYYWSVDDKGFALGPNFICSIPAESKSNHIRLCLVPELCRVEFNYDWSTQVNPNSGEIEYTESRKTNLIAGYDDKLSVNSSLRSRCFQWRVIEIPNTFENK